MQYIEIIWGLMNTGVGYMICGFIILFILNKIFDAKPAWQKYEGFMIGAIKAAERMIPDDAENKAANRTDAALNFFIKAYETAKKKKPSNKLMAEVANGMPIVHHQIEDKLKAKT